MVDGIGPAIFKSKALQRGDLILSINDEPLEDLIRERERFVIASTPAARRRRAILTISDSAHEESLKVHFIPKGESDASSVLVPCPDRSAPVPHYSYRNFKAGYDELDASTAYYCPGSFVSRDPAFAGSDPADRDRVLDPQYQEYVSIFGKLASKTQLILDLRGNPGGTYLLGRALTLHLIEPGFRYYALSSKREGSWSDPFWSIVEEQPHSAPRFEGRVVCLIDEYTLSAADNIACCLRDEHPNVTFIGQPSGGASGAPRVVSLPASGARVSFCTMRVYAPNGTPIEGNGVTPDIAVRPTREQMLAGTDAVLEAARAWLKR
jgi:hypothetical protein